MQLGKLCAAVLPNAPTGREALGSAARWLVVLTVIAMTADAARAMDAPPPGLFRCRSYGDMRAPGYLVVGELRIDGANYSYEAGYTAATTVRHEGTYRFVSEDDAQGRLKFLTGGLAGTGDAVWGPYKGSIFFRGNLCGLSAPPPPAQQVPIYQPPPGPQQVPIYQPPPGPQVPIYQPPAGPLVPVYQPPAGPLVPTYQPPADQPVQTYRPPR